MGMVGTGIDLELAQLLRTQARVREHGLDRSADGLLGPPLEQLAERLLLDPLGMSAVALVGLRLQLRRGYRDLAGIEHDHMIAGVEVRGPGRLVLAGEDEGDARGETTQRLIRRIDDEPAALDLACSRAVRLGVHASSCPGSIALSCCLASRPRTTRRRHSPRAGAAAPSSAGLPASSRPG